MDPLFNLIAPLLMGMVMGWLIVLVNRRTFSWRNYFYSGAATAIGFTMLWVATGLAPGPEWVGTIIGIGLHLLFRIILRQLALR